MIPDLSVQALEAALGKLAGHGVAVLPQALPAPAVTALREELLALDAAGQMQAAGVGRGQATAVREQIRGDRICWLEPEMPAAAAYLAFMEGLRQALNQAFYLGLVEYEAHYACYPPGGFYKKHVDRHRDLAARTISSVCYLNPEWPADAGGELLIYSPTGELLHRQQPQAGALVLFRSDDIPHEVLAASQQRLSIAGWFRRAF